MITRRPRSAAVDPYSATSRGLPCADSTFSSNVMARSSSSSQAPEMISRSASVAITMPTCGPAASSSCQTGCTWGSGCGSGMLLDRRCGADVRAVLLAGGLDHIDRLVGGAPGIGQVVPQRGDVQHPAAGRDQLTVAQRGAGVEHHHVLELTGRGG